MGHVAAIRLLDRRARNGPRGKNPTANGPRRIRKDQVNGATWRESDGEIGGHGIRHVASI
jgi:hypothetical protein